jgi:hypothetical protein
MIALAGRRSRAHNGRGAGMFEYLARDRRRLRRGTRAFAREVTVGEASVFVDHGFQWDGAKNVWLTRARASFVLGAGPAFDLRPRTLWTRVLGGRTALDPYFDEFFALRSDAEAETFDALTTRARTLLVGSFEDARLESDGTYVTLWREADFGREADAETAVELVSEVVTHRIDVIAQLRRLPGATYTAARGAWDDRQPPFVEVTASAPVQIGPAALGGRAVTTVRAACGRATAPFALQLGESWTTASDVPTLPGLVDAARGLGAEYLACDGQHLTLYLADLETSRDRLLSAASLIGSTATGRIGGLYR